MSDPTTEVDPRYSSEGFGGTSWSDARARLVAAELFWLTTVGDGGRPHQTPLIGLWVGDRFRFTTGPGEQKARNLRTSPHVLVTTGVDTWAAGMDVIVAGTAQRITDRGELQATADAYEAKYGADWHFDVGDGVFTHDAGEAWVFEVTPQTAHAYAKGEPGGQTRYRFE
jgi:hypothetical protein